MIRVIGCSFQMKIYLEHLEIWIIQITLTWALNDDDAPIRKALSTPPLPFWRFVTINRTLYGARDPSVNIANWQLGKICRKTHFFPMCWSINFCIFHYSNQLHRLLCFLSLHHFDLSLECDDLLTGVTAISDTSVFFWSILFSQSVPSLPPPHTERP